MQIPTSIEALFDNQQLVHRATARLQSRLGSHVRGLDITVQEGGLILRGSVDTYYGKQMAQQVVMELSDLRIACNEIEVH